MSESSWRSIMRTNFTRWEALAEYLELTEEQKKSILPNPRFVLNVPKRLAEKIAKGTLDDPILKQFLPMQAEITRLNTFYDDPVDDREYQRKPKLLHKYPGRVLLVCTSACAMHCRYCFRQNFHYEIQQKGFIDELDYIASDPTIKEVILSGGDPLSLSDGILKSLLDGISLISHVKRVRFHTRFPIGIPERIDASFLQLFHSLPFQVYFVVHVNHAKELDEDIFRSLKSLRLLGVTILNQAVLLKDVNDNVNALCTLFETLSDNGILPYYLHQLDRVQGASHFEVPIEKGQQLMKEAAKQLSGYVLPKYAQEIPGVLNKTLIFF